MSAVELADPDVLRALDRHDTADEHRETWGGVLVALVVVGVALRVLWSARNGASFDESFSAMVARKPLGELFEALRRSDSHPPLDYLLRAPLARAGSSDMVMRLPSLLFSVGALGLFAWWMRFRGVAGVVAVGLMAMSPFQIMYGGEARMYALLELLGVAAAMLSGAWLRAPRRWHVPAIGIVVLVGVFDHVSGFLLAAGLLALAGTRGDQEAWRWRAAIVAPIGLWAVVWGPSFREQASTTHASWIARTSWRSVVDALTGLITNQQGVALLVGAVIVVGVVIAVRADASLGRVVVCCGVVPVVLAAVIGVFAPFFIDRTLTIAAWMPCVVIGMTVQSVARSSRLYGVGATIVVAALVLPATLVFVSRDWEYDASINHLAAVVAPGDVVATTPGWYGPLVDWRIGVRMFGEVRPVHLAGLPDASAMQLGQRSGRRTWVLSFAGNHRTFPSSTRCAPDWTDGITVVSCLVRHAQG